MKFNAEQQWRCECRTCDEFAWLPFDPGSWSNVEPCDDTIFNFRGTCPRCRIIATGENPDADPAWPDHSVRQSGGTKPRLCGNCRFLGEPGVHALPGWSMCAIRVRLKDRTVFQPRVLPHHGSECGHFEETTR